MNPESKPGSQTVEKLAYSAKETCAAIGVSSVTLWRLSQRGSLRPVQGLRHRLFARAEIERFLSGNK
jgi:predicted site-specific integrase-resolvase